MNAKQIEAYEAMRAREERRLNTRCCDANHSEESPCRFNVIARGVRH